MTLAEGTIVASRYTVERFLAAGGMGAVYVARDATTGARVALKLSFAPRGDAELRARFEREAFIAHGLGRHPGIVRAHDWGEVPELGALFLVLDLVSDARPLDLAHGTLEQRVRRLLEATRIVARVHASGVLHRDLKPANFLAEPSGTLWLSDFGLAKLGDDADQDLLGAEATGVMRTASGMAFGTPPYMPPEQLDDVKRVDARADVYALGVMLFQALSGHLPYRVTSLANLLAQHARVREGRAAAPRPRDHDPGLPAALDDLALRATALDRTQRVASAEALARELETWLGSEVTTPPSPTPSRPRGGGHASTIPLVFRLGVVPILAGRDWVDETAFAAVEEWERWRVAHRHPGATLDVVRLRPRRADRGPLRLPTHEAFTHAVLGELDAKNQRWRAWSAQHAGAWAVLVRAVPPPIHDDAPSWETVPEADGMLWSAPVAHDGAELRAALQRFRASDRVAEEPLRAYQDVLEALGRLAAPAELIGAAIPEARCESCGLGSFHALLAALVRGEAARGAGAELVLSGVAREVRLRAADVQGAWRCPVCSGARVRLRFAYAWDDQRPPAIPHEREVHQGDLRAVSADPIDGAARVVLESSGAGRLVIVVSTRRADLDGVAARLRALGHGPERVVRHSPTAGLDSEAALVAGAADCLLLELGADPLRSLPLGAFRGEVKVVVTSPGTLTSSALDAVRRAIGRQEG